MKKVRFYERIIKAAIKRIHKALKYSYEGVKAMYKSEPSFQQDLVLFFVGMLVLCFLDITTTQKCILIISLFLIIMAEIVNTAIETIVDRISKEINPLSKKAKDIGSFLVMMSFILAFILWIMILF